MTPFIGPRRSTQDLSVSLTTSPSGPSPSHSHPVWLHVCLWPPVFTLCPPSTKARGSGPPSSRKSVSVTYLSVCYTGPVRLSLSLWFVSPSSGSSQSLPLSHVVEGSDGQVGA